jgi:hypothetical protein
LQALSAVYLFTGPLTVQRSQESSGTAEREQLSEELNYFIETPDNAKLKNIPRDMAANRFASHVKDQGVSTTSAYLNMNNYHLPCPDAINTNADSLNCELLSIFVYFSIAHSFIIRPSIQSFINSKFFAPVRPHCFKSSNMHAFTLQFRFAVLSFLPICLALNNEAIDSLVNKFPNVPSPLVFDPKIKRSNTTRYEGTLAGSH